MQNPCSTFWVGSQSPHNFYMLRGKHEDMQMRQVISFIFAVALFAGGAYLLYEQLLGGHGWRGVVILAGAMMLAAGGAWLVNDFVLPMMRGDAPRDD